MDNTFFIQLPNRQRELQYKNYEHYLYAAVTKNTHTLDDCCESLKDTSIAPGSALGSVVPSRSG